VQTAPALLLLFLQLACSMTAPASQGQQTT